MANGFKNARPLNAQRQAAIAKPDDKKDLAPRVKAKPGMNIFMVLPSFSDSSPLPYRHLHVHFNPFHMCLRPDPFEDADGNITIDKRYGPCPRCQSAWDTMVAEGLKGLRANDLPAGPQKDRLNFLSGNRAQQQLLWQVVDMTPFFQITEKRGVSMISVDPDKVKYMDEVAAVMLGESEGKDLPPDLLLAAQCAVSKMMVNKTNGDLMRDAYINQYMSLGENDPLMDLSDEENPKPAVSGLMKISLKDSDKSMETKKGNITIQKWTVSFVEAREVAGLKLTQKFIDAVAKLTVDLHNIKPEDETAKAISAAFQRLPSKEALNAYLAESEWTLGGLEAEVALEPEVVDITPSAPSLAKPQSSGLGQGGLMSRYAGKSEE